MMNSLFDIVSLLSVRLRREEGQTMAEYGILIAVIALIVIVAASFSASISALFSSTSGHL